MSWNNSENRADGQKAAKVAGSGRVSGVLKGTIGGLIVIVLALAFMFILRDKNDEPTETVVEKSKVSTIKEVAHSVVEKPVEPQESQAKIAEQKAKKERAEKLRAMTPEQRMDFIYEEAKNKPINLEPASNRVFATGTEQVLSWIFTTRLGDTPPPLPRISLRDEAHLEEIIANSVQVREGDSAKVADAKVMVEMAKEELAKYIKEGGDIQGFLEYYRGQLVQAHEEWKSSQKEVIKLIREEPEIAPMFIEEVNKRLSEKGIKPVVIPPKLKERLGIE